MEANNSISMLKGVGAKTTALFSKLHIETLDELIAWFPRGYDHFEPAVTAGELAAGKVMAVRACVIGTPSMVRAKGDHFEPAVTAGELAAGKVMAVRACVIGTPSMVRAKGMVITHVQVGDASGRLRMTWFRMPYIKNALPAGTWHIFRGMVKNGPQNMLLMEQPKIFKEDEYAVLAGTWQPKYALTAGITNHMILKCVRQALDKTVKADYLTEELRERYHLIGLSEALEKIQELRERYHLIGLSEALEKIHFPKDEKEVCEARRRLVFDEFLAFLVQIKRRKAINDRLVVERPLSPAEETERLIGVLPYELTGAQQKVWRQIEADLGRHIAMNRLVQGDVGSGKTILAFLALLTCSANGRQGCL